MLSKKSGIFRLDPCGGFGSEIGCGFSALTYLSDR